MKKTLLLLAFCLVASHALAWYIGRNHFRLSGQWKLKLSDTYLSATDIQKVNVLKLNYDDIITLPGTTDTNHKGNAPTRKDETTRLTRLHSFVGQAWYEREIEIGDWMKDYPLELVMVLERTKPTAVFVDGHFMGTNDNISTPQEYNLTKYLKPGKHRLTIMVDNTDRAVPPQVVTNSHAYTDDTQTNWNGILGRMTIEMRSALHIRDIDIETSAQRHEVDATINIEGRMKGDANVEVLLVPWGSAYGIVISQHTIKKDKLTEWRLRVKYQDEGMLTWSEFHPELYRLCVTVNETDMMEKPFALCDFSTNGTQFAVNGQTTFLRGKHDACVFPLTGHVPMDMEQWRRYFQVCKGYGINHVRFHSWCPPEACFMAADIEGIYLQPELPFWGDLKKDDQQLTTFLIKEGINIIRAYGHHPSFKMMALGNELWGDITTMERFVDTFRKMAPDKLFTFGSNYYLGYQGWHQGMDYFTTCRNGGEERGQYNTHTRGSFSFADAHDGGIINHFYPNSTMNFADAIKGLQVPVISHETGQFQTYPDYGEISKYRGVLYPYNLEEFRRRLNAAGMGDQAQDFHRASGLWSMELYKADIEMDLRTPGFGGFQLLDIQDYPGQGSAYVGVLDAFMESKGLITPDEFRQFCSPIVPLFVAEKFCFTTGEQLKGHVQLANYAEPFGEYAWDNGQMAWQIADREGAVLDKGVFNISENSHGLTDVGDISFDISGIKRPQQLCLTLKAFYNKASGKCHENNYKLWVFPRPDNAEKAELERVKKKIAVCHRADDDFYGRLSRGESVLLMPDTTQMKDLTIGGLFQTDYWNYRMFKTISENNNRPVSPGTLGILTDPAHPLFGSFPTDGHTSWQWFPVIKASRPFMLDNTAAAYRPLVQVIDNVERNHKLGLIFEFSVGKGKLLVCMSPLDELGQYAEAQQLYASMLKYMASPAFSPATAISIGDLKKLFSTPVTEGTIGVLNNISPY